MSDKRLSELVSAEYLDQSTADFVDLRQTLLCVCVFSEDTGQADDYFMNFNCLDVKMTLDIRRFYLRQNKEQITSELRAVQIRLPSPGCYSVPM